MRMRRLIAPAFFVSLASTFCVESAFAQPPPPPPAAEPAPSVTGAGKDVPATSPPLAPEPAQVQPAQVAPAGAPQGDSTKAAGAEFTSLRLMRAKGIISEAEYESALHDLGESTGMRAADGNTFVLGKWATTLYGFVEGDTIYDTTQGLNEIAGNTQIPKHGSIAGDKDRMQFSVRNSRIGFRIKAPEANGVRASAQLEMDFFGGANPASGAEATVFNNSVMRVRHMNFKLETPVLDLLVGQYWTLYGWHAAYLPATVEIQGVPAGIFSRQMQVQLSKTVKTSDVTFEIAVAALRPPQRDGALPAGQGGLRIAANKWTAPQTANFTGTTIQPLSLAVTGDVRSFRITDPANPTSTQSKAGESVAVDAFIPVIPGTKESRGNSLALNGELSIGSGISDMYTGMTGGLSLPTAVVAPATTPVDLHVDNGLVGYDNQANLHLVQITSFVGGIQYYLPGSGNVFVSANYSRAQLGNAGGLGTAAKTRNAEDWFDFNVFWDATSAVRFGAEYANFHDAYNDGSHSINQRVQVSGAFLF